MVVVWGSGKGVGGSGREWKGVGGNGREWSYEMLLNKCLICDV